jgi:cytochrome c-type biogenesis protein CcmH/NrfG
LLLDALAQEFERERLPSLWNQLGVCYVMNEQFDQAENAFLQGIKYAPENLDLLSNLADLYLRQEKFDVGTEYITRALRVDPADVNTLLLLGNVSVQLEDFDAALIAFAKVQELAPSTPGVDAVVEELAAQLDIQLA